MQSFTSELISAGCDMSKLSKRALKHIKDIEDINTPIGDSMYKRLYNLTTAMDTAERRKKCITNCTKMIKELTMKPSSIEEDSYKLKMCGYFNDGNYISACNCVIILEALSLEEVVEHDSKYYELLRKLHDELLNLISLEVL